MHTKATLRVLGKESHNGGGDKGRATGRNKNRRMKNEKILKLTTLEDHGGT